MPRRRSAEKDQSSAALSARLTAALREVADFPRPGILFRDITPVLGDPMLFGECVRALASAGREYHAEVVAGVESRGFILGAPVAYQLGGGFVPIRKGGHLPAATISAAYALEYGEATLEVHTDAIRAGQRVLIVDDLLATGGTAAAAIKLVESLGGVVAGMAFLIELAQLNGVVALTGHDHTSLITL
jgi:adenine phosphoribosyltransferase